MLRLLLPLVAAVPLIGRAQERLDPRIRSALAERTVVVQDSRTIMGRAAGFVWRHHGDSVDVVTIFAPGGSPIMTSEVRVISHPGTPEETTTKGTLVAYDPDSGLAAIRVGARSLPKPLLVSTAPIKTGAPLHVATGVSAGAANGSATIAVAPMHLGATRTSQTLTLLQLDGEIQPGGEGGPVILPNGRIVGITYPSLPGTLRGLALPISHLACLSAGTVGEPVGFVLGGPERHLNVSVPLLDLDRKIKSLSVYIAPQLKPEAAEPDERGSWSLVMPDTVARPCEVKYPCGVWKQPLKELGLAPGRYRCQARAVLRDGSESCSPPGWITIPEPPAPKREDEKKVQTRPVVPRIPTIDTVRCEPPKAPVPLTIARSSDRKVGGLRFSEFTFQPLANEEQFGGQVIRRKPASSAATAANVRDAVWDDDGKSFYLLCRTGSWGTSSSILRFGHDAETSACQVALNVSVDAILYSPQGLVAVVPNRGFLLLDPVSLELTKRVSMPGMIELVVPRRGPYGLALCAADPGAETHSDGTPFSNQPMLLCGIDLSTGRVTKTYGAGHLPLPLAPDVLLPIEAARHQGVSITDDGRYALLGYHQGHWRWLTICPFRDGALRTESAQRLDLYCGTLIPVPGGSRMLAECGGATQDAALKPPEGDDKTGKSRLFLFDAAKPDAPGSWFWADRGAFLGDRFLTFDHTQTLRVFRRDGSEEVSLQLEPPATRNTNRLEHIVTCPGGRTALLSRNRVWYSLGPGSPPPAVPEETIAASLASKTNPLEPEAVETQPPPVDGTPLQVETGQSLDVQWQRLLPKPEWGSPLCQLAADGRTLYVLSTAGKLRRLDLGTLVETAVTDEGMPCVGLGLSSAGVLVAVASKDVREVRVRDPRDLRLLNTYPHTIDITAIASRPTTPITCLLTKDGHIMLMDSARGRIVQTYQKLPLPEANAKALPANMLPPPGFLLISISSRPTKPISLLAMTPDGTQLFTALGGKLVRYRLEDAKLVPLAVARQAIGDVGYVTLDQDGTYVGVISDHPVTSLDGWQPDLAQGMTKRQVALVFDAETLDAVYQAPTGGSEDHFVFDKDGSQLVTALLSRCTPQGRSLNSGCIVPFGSTTTQLLAGTDGWFLASTKSGLYRFRFVPRAVSFHEWERRQ